MHEVTDFYFGGPEDSRLMHGVVGLTVFKSAPVDIRVTTGTDGDNASAHRFATPISL